MDIFSFLIALLNFPTLFTNIFGFRLVGLTGGISTGKSTATKIIKNLGIPVIDFDLIAREVVQPGSSCLKSITKEFGDDILNPDGSLNRTKLGAIIFKDASKRKTLNKLMQRPIMFRFFWILLQMFFLGQISSKSTSPLTNTPKDEGPHAASHGIATSGLYPGLEQPFNGSKVVVLDCPLLFESGISNLCSSTVYIHCDEETQLTRLMARDSLSREQAQDKIKAQWGVDKKLKMVKNIIKNDTTEKELYTNITTWWMKMTKDEFGLALMKPLYDFDKKMGPLLALQRSTQEAWTAYTKQAEAYTIQQQNQALQQSKAGQSSTTPPIQPPLLPAKYDKTKLFPRVTDLLDTTTQPSFWEIYSPLNFTIKPTLLSLLFTAILALPSYFIIQWIEHSWFGTSTASTRAAVKQFTAEMQKPPK